MMHAEQIKTHDMPKLKATHKAGLWKLYHNNELIFSDSSREALNLFCYVYVNAITYKNFLKEDTNIV